MATWYKTSGYKSKSAAAAAGGGHSKPPAAKHHYGGFAGLTLPGGQSTFASPGDPVPYHFYDPEPGGYSNAPFKPAVGGAAASRLWGRAIPWIGFGLFAYELWDLWRHTAGGRAGMKMLGYTLTLDCGRPVDFMSTASSSICGAYFGQPAISVWNGVNFQSLLGGWQGTPPAGLHRPAERWSKTAAAPRPHNIGQPAPDSFVGGEPKPWVPNWPRPDIPNPTADPTETPIAQPMPMPAPMPWRNLPQLDDSPWRETGPYPQPDFNPEEDPYEWEFPVPVPSPQPSPSPTPFPPTAEGPSPAPEPSPAPTPFPPPGATGGPVVRWGPRVRQRPGRREKEKKVRSLPGAAQIVYRAANWVTETADLVDSFWWALPAKYRSRPVRVGDHWEKPPLQAQLRDLYRHWDKVDMDKALKGVVNNMLEDAAIGAFGEASKRGARASMDAGFRHNSPFGFGTGPAL